MNNDLLNSLNDFTIKEENLYEKITKNIYDSFSETIDVEENEIINNNFKRNIEIFKKSINNENNLYNYFINNLSSIFLLSSNEFETKINKIKNKEFLDEEDIKYLIYSDIENMYIPDYLKMIIKKYNLEYSNLLLYRTDYKIENDIEDLKEKYGDNYINTINLLFMRERKMELLFKNSLLNNCSLIVLDKNELAYKINALKKLNILLIKNDKINDDLYISVEQFEKKYNIDLKTIKSMYKEDFYIESFKLSLPKTKKIQKEEIKKEINNDYKLISSDKKSSIEVKNGDIKIESPYLDIDSDLDTFSLLAEIAINDVRTSNNKTTKHTCLNDLINNIIMKYPLLLYLKNEYFLNKKLKEAITLYQKIMTVNEYGKIEAELFYQNIYNELMNIEKLTNNKYISSKEYESFKNVIMNIKKY